MVGPDGASSSNASEPTETVPGHFVTDDLEVDCRRFLDDVRALVQRRITPAYADESPQFFAQADATHGPTR